MFDTDDPVTFFQILARLAEMRMTHPDEVRYIALQFFRSLISRNKDRFVSEFIGWLYVHAPIFRIKDVDNILDYVGFFDHPIIISRCIDWKKAVYGRAIQTSQIESTRRPNFHDLLLNSILRCSESTILNIAREVSSDSRLLAAMTAEKIGRIDLAIKLRGLK